MLLLTKQNSSANEMHNDRRTKTMQELVMNELAEGMLQVHISYLFTGLYDLHF